MPYDYEHNIEESIERTFDIKEEITKNDTRSLWLTIWGADTWGKMFSNRQMRFLYTLATHIANLEKPIAEADQEYYRVGFPHQK